MGYLLPGGRLKRFGDSLLPSGPSDLITVPSVSPTQAGSLTSRIGRSKTAASDISKTAPTFNDPRYSFTTLSIPTDLRTLNGLYRFFDDTDPVVGNALRLHCLPPGSLILTAEGSKPIETLTTSDYVISKNGQYQKILDTVSRPHTGNLVNLKVTGCTPVTYTAEHRLLTCMSTRIQTRKDSSKRIPTKELVWKEAQDITTDDYVVFPKWKETTSIQSLDLSTFISQYQTSKKSTTKIYDITDDKINVRLGTKNSHPRYLQITPEFAEFAGWFVAEGHTVHTKKGRGHHLRFALHKDEIDSAKRLQCLAKTLFNANSSIHKGSSENAIEVYVGTNIAVQTMKALFGTGAHNKKIHSSILNSNNPEITKSFLKAYIAGDGCRSNKYDISMITVSSTLAYQLRLLGTKIGLFFNLREAKNRANSIEYTLRITKRSSLPLLYDKPHIKQKKHPHYVHQDDSYFYLPVRRISTEDYIGTVYDIKTEDSTFLHQFIIHNCEFPLSRISLKDHGDPIIESHYEEMWNRVSMDKLLFDIALEYWRIGNVFPYGAWNVADRMWDQFVVLNPDYVTVESTYLNQKPFIKLQPDVHLKKVVTTGRPKFLYDQLPKEIIKYVRMGQEIPLSPQNVFHIAHNKSPYETLGRSIIKRILKSLIYEDRMSMANFAIATRQTIPITVVKLGDPNSGWVPEDSEMEEVRALLSAREVDPNFCYDEETECLTDKGWLKYTDLTYDHKIASFTPEGNHLEYHKPQAITIQDYDDDMIHFKNRKIDCKVTPNHRMWVKRDNRWQVIFAQDVVETDILRTCVDSYEYTPLEDKLKIADKEVDTGDFFEFIGWYISEGSISSYGKGNKNYGINITQTKQGSFDLVKDLMDSLPWEYKLYQDCQFTIANISLGDYLEENFGKGSNNKKLPRWVLDAPPEYLERLFTSYIEGDGTTVKTKRGEFYQTHTASKELADNLQEIGLKLGYSVSLVEKQPKLYKYTKTGEIKYKKVGGSDFFLLHRLNFSKDRISLFPSLKRRKDYQPMIPIPNTIERGPYKGKIWCVSVPPGIIITRRGGKQMVAGQTIVYHWGIDIQFYGASGKIWNLTNEFNRIMKWKLLGLGVSESILTGAGSYASAYAQLEVLRQRYLHFQNTLQNFVYRGVFEPVAKQCGFYKTENVVAGKYYKGKKFGSPDGELAKLGEIMATHSKTYGNIANDEYMQSLQQKTSALENNIAFEYPKLDWDLLSLSNDVQYRNFLMNFDRLFPGQRKVSDATFYTAAKLDRETERMKITQEHSQNLEDALEQGKISKDYEKKFMDAGIPFPGAAPAGQQGPPAAGGTPGGPSAPGTTPGPGGMSIPPGAAPPLGGTGGGNTMGAPAMVPNAPVGQNTFNGQARTPEVSRLRSMQLHEKLTTVATEINKENNEEVIRLRKFNRASGLDIDTIDKEVEANVKSSKDIPKTDS